ncbi:MAG: hypothetical protein N2489_11675 [Clostridia bacterium]|nr:hypothetical protein [Clostridia bacterium]
MNEITQDRTLILRITALDELICMKALVDERVESGSIAVFAVIWDGDGSGSLSSSQKRILFDWLNSLEVLSAIAVDGVLSGDLLDVFMMFDIRIAGESFAMHLPENPSDFVFNFDARRKLLLGKEGYVHKELASEAFILKRLINLRIDMNEAVNEINKYIGRIIGDKSIAHVKAIVRCFNSYKKNGLDADRDLLLEEEAKQFCTLIVNSRKSMG